MRVRKRECVNGNYVVPLPSFRNCSAASRQFVTIERHANFYIPKSRSTDRSITQINQPRGDERRGEKHTSIIAIIILRKGKGKRNHTFAICFENFKHHRRIILVAKLIIPDLAIVFIIGGGGV